MDKQDNGETIPVRRAESLPKSTEADIYEAASRSTADYATFEPKKPTSNSPKKSRHSPKKFLFIFLALLLLLGISGGAYWYLKNRKTTTPNAPTVSQDTPKKEALPSPTPDPDDASLKHYVSTAKKLSLEFDYPGNWQVTPKAAETATSDKPIVLDSPTTSIKDASGASVKGKVTIQIRPRGPSITELESGSAKAAQDSVQIAYANPSSGQNKYPFLSFIRLTGGAIPNNGFEEVILTGIQDYKKGSSINPVILGSIDPLVSASFYTCKDTNCSATLSITNDTWQNNEVTKQVLSVFQSLKIN